MKRVLIIPLLFIAFALSAAPIGERKAREIATSFFAKTSTLGQLLQGFFVRQLHGAPGELDHAVALEIAQHPGDHLPGCP